MKKLFFVLAAVALALYLTGRDEPKDLSIGQITISGIPASFPKHQQGGGGAASNTFKVYLNASNSMDPTVLPVAKGLIKVDDTMKVGDTYTVTINLQKANPKNGEDPNTSTEPWSGTSNYFSIMISPKDVRGGIETVWARGGMTLNNGKRNITWNSLINFRGSYTTEDNKWNSLVNVNQINALWTDIILLDTDLERPSGP